MNCWRERKANLKYDILYVFYMILALFFYVRQNSPEVFGEKGIQNFSGLVGAILYNDLFFLRVMILLPLCIVVLLRIRAFFREQYIIRKKNRKRIYLAILGVCLRESLLFSVLFSVFLLGAGKIFYGELGAGFAKEAGTLLYITFGIFFTMNIVSVSLKWIMGNDIAGIVVICGLGISDSITCYNSVHIALAVILAAVILLSAEKKEFYLEKY